MKKITYLLGAGASSPTLPLVKGIPEKRLKGINELLEEVHYEIENTRNNAFERKTISTQASDGQLKFIADKFKWLKENALRHASIDTFAKKLHIRGDFKKLHDLKFTLSLLFTYLQCSQPPNPKYDSFFASVLKLGDANIARFPEEIKILTWNYDLQMELASLEYFGLEEIGQLDERLLFYPRQNYLSSTHRPAIVHLNGIAGLYEISQDSYRFTHLLRFFNMEPYKIIDELACFNVGYQQHSMNFDNLFTFAWERRSYDDRIIDEAKKIAAETEVLVIIGYSFPFFNREYDRALFAEFSKNNPTIYIQNPNLDATNLKDKFPVIKNCDIRQINQIDQFHLPEEL